MSRQIDKKTTKQVRVDSGLHKILKVMAAEEGRTLKSLLEECLVELLGPVNKNEG